MSRVVSVDKSLIAGGTIQWFVTMEDGNQSRTRIEVGEAEAHRFQKVLQSQQDAGPKLLTETYP